LASKTCRRKPRKCRFCHAILPFATETSLIKNSRTSPYYPKTSLKKRVIATLYCASARTSEGFYAARTYWNKRNQCLLFSFRDLNGDIAKFHNAELGRDLPVCQLHRDGRRNWSDELDQTIDRVWIVHLKLVHDFE
jgi:hypothetical protein